MHIASIGIDLGKATFHLVALGERNGLFGTQLLNADGKYRRRYY